jgi:hypothetical protein
MENPPFVVRCPKCSQEIIIEEINCRIFRHAVNKFTGQQMNPHASKTECDEAVIQDTIYGCASPFIIDLSGNKWLASLCDYI